MKASKELFIECLLCAGYCVRLVRNVFLVPHADSTDKEENDLQMVHELCKGHTARKW